MGGDGNGRRPPLRFAVRRSSAMSPLAQPSDATRILSGDDAGTAGSKRGGGVGNRRRRAPPRARARAARRRERRGARGTRVLRGGAARCSASSARSSRSRTRHSPAGTALPSPARSPPRRCWWPSGWRRSRVRLAPRRSRSARVSLLLVLFVWIMLGDGVLDLPWLRAAGENLIARRGDAPPRVWLVAHVDSKSQPLPTQLRMAGSRCSRRASC